MNPYWAIMKRRKQHKSMFYHKLYAAYRDRLCEQLDGRFPTAIYMRQEIRDELSYDVFVKVFVSLSNIYF